MRKQKFYFFLISALIITLLVSCAPAATAEPVQAPTQAQEQAAEPTEAEAAAETGGTLTFAIATDQTLLDPLATTYNVDIILHNNIYRQLYRVNADGSGLEPFAAESYDVNDEATVWTFTLRDDIKFSDGTPITADDVVYSIERGFSDTSLWAWIYEEAGLAPGKTTAIDDRTVQFELSAPFVPFVSYVSGYWASIFPKGSIEAVGEDEFFKKPICSGEWMVDEFVQADHLTIVPNPYAVGQAKLDKIVFPMIPDDNTRMLQLQTGQIDVAYVVPASQIDSINSLPGLTVKEYPFAYTAVLYDNQTKAPFDDANFRRALNYAIDRDALMKAVAFGHASFPTSFLPKGVIYWDNQIEGFPYDLEKAKEYMAQSKYADGISFELWTTTTSATGVETATALQGMWNQLPGVNVDVVQLEPAVLRDKTANMEHTVYVGGFSSDVADPAEITAWFVTGYINDARRGGNVDAVKPMLADANKELDPAKRQQMFYDIQQWVQDNAFAFNLYYTNNNWGMKESVQDLWVNPLLIMDLNNVWIQK
jgi:peptide/nickel transport system substrate-binding protein